MDFKKICIDMDGVITDIAGSMNKEMLCRGLDDFDYTDLIVLREDDRVDVSPLSVEIFSNPVFWKNMKPFYDAWYCINDWFFAGHEIHIITSRSSDAAKAWASAWLDMWNIPYHKVWFAHQCHKFEIFVDLGGFIMMDDNPHEIEAFVAKGLNGFMKRGWYNQDYWHSLPTVGSFFDIDLKLNGKEGS